ncbi:hypothetical protein K432DRAFT_311836 [Lepidopterella palustris CBS 459.81]|uniref:Chitin-binding type-1 domain-containing protein n=1 Tax=Lepidopterella palustris CBS 459.81 TaxID=1314670 RepID=A0A8E2DYF8_9PEZI|nr:hypothetical protein K432DRAFT_311836 [Lepidopterella palustris CBS 459.81]
MRAITTTSLGLGALVACAAAIPHSARRRFEPWVARQALVSDCRLNILTTEWTNCQQVLDAFSLTLSQFVALNPSVGSNCANFSSGTTYCARVSSPVPVSTDATCGAQVNWTNTCIGSQWGDCCSASGYIGNCQEGSCDGAPTVYSTDGRCGEGFADVACGGSFGSCCSNDGWCGSDADHCGVGNCQSGACAGSTATTSSLVPTATPGSLSPDGTCGFANRYVCSGSTYGSCCSAAGWCGSDEYHCSGSLGWY